MDFSFLIGWFGDLLLCTFCASVVAWVLIQCGPGRFAFGGACVAWLVSTSLLSYIKEK